MLGSVMPSQAAPSQQATFTPTATLRPIPKLFLKAITQRSPVIDGQIGGNIVADLPLDGGAKALFGGLFEFVIPNAPNGTRVVFEVRDGNDNLIYKHTERNKPFCPFQDTNNKCNPLPIRDGQFFWPDSDGIAGRPVTSGRHKLLVQAFDGDGDDENTICFTTDTSGNLGAFEFDIKLEFETPVQLPPLTGRVALISPKSGAVLGGVVNVRGSATSNNFAYYKFELVDSRCQSGVCFMIDFKKPVNANNGILWRWDTRQPLSNGTVLPNGTWVIQLVVADKWGRTLPNPPQIQVTIQN